MSNPKKAEKDYLAAQSLSTLTILGGLGAGSAIFLILVFFVWYCKRRQYENNIKRRKVKKYSILSIFSNIFIFVKREELYRRKESIEKRKTIREAREKVRQVSFWMVQIKR